MNVKMKELSRSLKLDRIVKTALSLRGILKKSGDAGFVKYEGPVTGDEELKLSGVGDYDKAADFVRKNGRYPAGISVGDTGSFTIRSEFDNEGSGEGFKGIAVVTGGAQGFGAGLVRDLVHRGYFVYAADRNYQGAEDFVRLLNKEAGRTVSRGIEVDVTSEESVEKMVESVVLQSGGIDLFISNAGVLKAGSVKEMSLGDFEFVTSVDYTGFFICTKHVASVMSVMNKYGGDGYTDIIQINSKSGLEGSNKNGAYAGAKFGSIGLVQSFALELVEDRIKVNAVCPGNFLDGPLWSDPENGLFVQYLKAGKVPGAETVEDVRKFYENKVPMKRGCTVEDVSRAIYYIVEQKYETGQAIPVTGGQIMLH